VDEAIAPMMVPVLSSDGTVRWLQSVSRAAKSLPVSLVLGWAGRPRSAEAAQPGG